VSTAETTMAEWKIKSNVRKLHCFDLTKNKLPPVGIYASQRSSFCGYDEHLIKTNGFSIYGQLTEEVYFNDELVATNSGVAYFPDITPFPRFYQVTINGVPTSVVRSPEFPPLENAKAIATWKNLNNCPTATICKPRLLVQASVAPFTCIFNDMLKLGDNTPDAITVQGGPATGTVTVNIAVDPLT